MSLVYIYDGSFDGILTAVFEAFSRKEQPDAIAEQENLQVTFGQHCVRIETDTAKAARVERGIQTKLGNRVMEAVWVVYLSSDLNKAGYIYRYLVRAFEIGRKIYNDIAHSDVLIFNKLQSAVQKESYYFSEFLRFSLMQGGVYYACISPEHNVVSLMMPHFTDRYNDQPFLIHDDVHQVVGVYRGGSWHLVETPEINLPDEADEELSYKRMWKDFYDTIAIKERYNPRCRRGHMPKKYWKHMTEFTFVETPKTRAQDERMKVKTESELSLQIFPK